MKLHKSANKFGTSHNRVLRSAIPGLPRIRTFMQESPRQKTFIKIISRLVSELELLLLLFSLSEDKSRKTDSKLENKSLPSKALLIPSNRLLRNKKKRNRRSQSFLQQQARNLWTKKMQISFRMSHRRISFENKRIQRKKEKMLQIQVKKMFDKIASSLKCIIPIAGQMTDI